jgi:CheY-like chemotaxis protein/nitrogen-specific signal transduction histidine kinase
MSLEEKAEQLTVISKYKSEFLANMSHELRTPLNSLMILAKLLSDNKGANLSPKQIEFANTIYAAGNDLLSLINEILDLSKVESGKMGVDARRIPLTELGDYVERSFRHVAQQKNLHFSIYRDPALPPTIVTDGGRLQQVLRNLLSNAFKFTEVGRVSLQIRPADRSMKFENEVLNQAERVFAFTVTDTGIGIPAEKQRLIFEAFQQADGTTSRKYGGTGLGLTISREIARLLGGEIRVESQPGHGSTFTLYLPGVIPSMGPDGQPIDVDALTTSVGSYAQPLAPSQTPYPTALQSAATQASTMYLSARNTDTESVLGRMVEDDRASLSPGDRVLLIVEDEASFARTLMPLAHEQGFKCLVASNGEAGLVLARQYQPDAITLDLQLPGMDGWTVLERLKADPNTRHIPVQIISVHDRDSLDLGNALGAISYLEKPVSREALDSAFVYLRSVIDREVKDLLVVEDDPLQRTAITELLADSRINLTAVGSGAEAIELLAEKKFDCVVLDLMLPDMTGFELVELLKSDEAGSHLPVIVYTCKDLTNEEKGLLTQFAESVIVKDANAPSRLVEETAKFLNRIDGQTPAVTATVPSVDAAEKGDHDGGLAGKTVLVVDDDVRNIFALASGLEAFDMHVLYAENGLDAIAMLKKHPEVDLVLMDIMMPEMDGYETTAAIRQLPALQGLPIIALTAKAMPGDREKCLEAGASDYITKPVDMDQLIRMMSNWVAPTAPNPAT